MRSLVPVDTIATDICIDELGDSTEKYNVYITKKLAEGFKEMHLFMSPIVNVKTVVMPVDHVVDMPCDFVYETKVGVRLASDKPKNDNPIALLWRNYHQLGSQSVPGSHSESEAYLDSIINGTIRPEEMATFYNYNGVNVLDGYGTGVNPQGFYDLDQNKGSISVGSMWPSNSEIVIEYKTDGISNGFELVPTEMVTALTNYALWKFYLKKKDSRYAEYKNDYLTQYYMIKDLYTFRSIDYLSLIMQNTPRQTINDLL